MKGETIGMLGRVISYTSRMIVENALLQRKIRKTNRILTGIRILAPSMSTEAIVENIQRAIDELTR